MRMRSQLLTKEHNRTNFTCGNEALDRYLAKLAMQDIKRNLAACYVIMDNDSNEVLAYYTLSSFIVERHDIPEDFTKLSKLPYADLPVFMIGRLAVHKDHQGKGIGGATLISAFKQALHIKEQIGCCAVVVDPKDEDAERFYIKHSFIKLSNSRRMFLPMATIEKLLKD